MYLNLDLEASGYEKERGRERFRVRVVRSPAGEQPPGEADRVALPRSLRKRLLELEVQGLPKPALIELGEELGSLLFPPKARGLLERTLGSMAELDRLRIRIASGVVALADLPWEYAYLRPKDTPAGQPGMDGFLALDPRISLVRSELLAEEPKTLDPVDVRPLRLVALLASPKALPPLALDEEQAYLRKAVERIGLLEAAYYPDATVDALEEALERPVHVFHFSGHGVFEGRVTELFETLEGAGSIVLLGEEGAPYPFPAEKLALSLKARGVRLAVLGACHTGRRDETNAWTGVVPALVKKGDVPAVLGMQYTIKDSGAVQFSRKLYEALADGDTIDAAVTAGRRAIFNRSSDDDRDWGVPVLYLRTDRGVLFPPPAAARAASWPDVAALARQQADRFLREARGTAGRPGRFVPELHVRRPGAQSVLDAFAGGGEPALLVTGDSGAGKTSLLVQWALDLLESGHAVFLYACGGSFSGDVEGELARDFGLDDPGGLPEALASMGRLAAAGGKRLAAVFDGINEFRGRGGAGPPELLRAVDALVGRLPQEGVLVAASCNAATWRRLEREGAAELSWSRYFRPDGGRVLDLQAFTPEELEEAYGRYRTFFDLKTPFEGLRPSMRESLRVPLALRMTAEAHRGGELPAGDGLGLKLLRESYERRVSRRRDVLFLDALAGAMLEERRSALSIHELAHRGGVLKEEIESADPGSSYNLLLDEAILVESFDKTHLDDLVQFTHPRFGAFVLALHAWRASRDQAGARIREMAAGADDFALGWDVGRALLALSARPELFAELAGSPDASLRELAVEGLIELHGAEPESATDLLKRLLGEGTEEALRTALKAAYLIGPGARDVFLWAAVEGGPELRRAVADVLYLRWRTDPDFTYGLMGELASMVRLRRPQVTRSVLESAGDLSITIYVNHCDQPDVGRRTSDFWHEVLKRRLRLNVLVPPPVAKLVAAVAARVFSERIVETALVTDVQPPEVFFGMPAAEKDRFRRAAALTDPAADLRPHRDDLAALLRSEVIPCRILAGLVLAAHAYDDPARTEPVARELFEEQQGLGRLWELIGFTVLLPDPTVASAWVGFLEDFTRRLAGEHAEVFFGADGVVGGLDLTFLPLGLAYGKTGGAMACFDELIRAARKAGDAGRWHRCLAALGPVGFYWCEPVLATMKGALARVGAAEAWEALAPPLGMMRLMHPDAVEGFLRRQGAGEAVWRRVAAASDVERVRRYLFSVGIYNSAVHQAVSYPRMRRGLLIPALTGLAAAGGPQEFVTEYTALFLKMLRKAGYRLIEWTRPD